MLLSPRFLSTSSSFYVYFIWGEFCSRMGAISHLLWHEVICWHLKLKESTLQFKDRDKCKSVSDSTLCNSRGFLNQVDRLLKVSKSKRQTFPEPD